MSDVANLKSQLDAELGGAVSRAQQRQQAFDKENQERKQRVEKLDAVLERLRKVWGPRLEMLKERFANVAKVQPDIRPHARGVTFSFSSPTDAVDLKFSAYPDRDVQKLILDYDLQIIPMLMPFDRTAQLEMPLDKIDEAAVGKWLDEQILKFVKTFIKLRGDEFFREHAIKK